MEHLDSGLNASANGATFRYMTDKAYVPFGGVQGWLADLTIQAQQPTKSYYVAEPEIHRAMAAIRAHAKVKEGAIVTLRRALSRGEITGLKLKPGEVKPA